jgi:5-methyltetrahydrofolate--homocysteine methyltransferase
MDAVFPLVKRYGGAIVGLCLDEQGIPATSDGRLAIARRILDEGAKYGFGNDDFVFDALTLAVSADPNAAVVTLETVRRLSEELGVNTVLGVSNVSFGLPNRPALNNAMYALAKRNGLSAAIANPSLIRDELDSAAEDVLLARDTNCERWIAANANVQAAPSASSACSGPELLGKAISRGLRGDAAEAAKAMLDSGMSAMDVIEKAIVPALEQVGNAFEKGTAFLPQLLMAADAAGDAFAVVRKKLSSCNDSRSGRTAARPIVIATVKGDIHDIGKNIVRALLENYGFDVIDLGRDVAPETIVERARACNAGMIGLSALMTTTVGAMAETIRLAKAAGLDAKTFVGGAVVTQEYADSIGADFYAKDAMQSVRIAERVLRG